MPRLLLWCIESQGGLLGLSTQINTLLKDKFNLRSHKVDDDGFCRLFPENDFGGAI